MSKGEGIKLAGAKGYTGLWLIPIEEWSQFFGECNWYTFRPVHVEIEDDRIMGGVEFTIIILGLGARLRLNYARTEKIDEIDQRVAEVFGAPIKARDD